MQTVWKYELLGSFQLFDGQFVGHLFEDAAGRLT
jgi:hypothetical protein